MLVPIKLAVNILLAFIEFFLGFQFILRLFGARTTTPFVEWIYNTAAPLIHPFEGMFPPVRFEGFVFDFTTLFALFAYMFVGYLILSLLDYLDYAVSRRVRP